MLGVSSLTAAQEFGIGRSARFEAPDGAGGGAPISSIGTAAAASEQGGLLRRLVSNAHFWTGVTIFGTAAAIWYATEAHVSIRGEAGAAGEEVEAGASAGGD